MGMIAFILTVEDDQQSCSNLFSYFEALKPNYIKPILTQANSKPHSQL
jgi:hypothetical protein